MASKEIDKNLFLENVYTEIKDLGKQFLTLVSGILAFTVTFADKIIDFEKSLLAEKLLLFASWTAFIAAIVTVGFGLWLNYNASMQALSNSIDDAWTTTLRTYRRYRIGIYSFGFGLICLVLSAATRMFAH